MLLLLLLRVDLYITVNVDNIVTIHDNMKKEKKKTNTINKIRFKSQVKEIFQMGIQRNPIMFLGEVHKLPHLQNHHAYPLSKLN